jgi:hypothetical protein
LGNVVAFGGAFLGLSALSYTAAVTVIVRRQGKGVNYYTYAGLGAVALVAGLSCLPWAPASALVLAALGPAMVWLSHHKARRQFRLHAALFALAAMALSGLVGLVWDAFTGAANQSWTRPDATMLATLAGLAGTYAILKRPWRDPLPTWAGTLPAATILLAALTGLGALVVGLLASPLAGVATSAPDPGALAVLRTGCLATAIALLAILSRYRDWSELRPLVTLLSIATLVKLALEDLPHGRANTLFGSLLFFGGALIIAAGTGRRRIGAKSDSAMSVPAQPASPPLPPDQPPAAQPPAATAAPASEPGAQVDARQHGH